MSGIFLHHTAATPFPASTFPLHLATAPVTCLGNRRIVQLYNGIQYSEIFTLAVYVVRRFEGPDATEQRIGQLSGLLVSHHCCTAAGCTAHHKDLRVAFGIFFFSGHHICIAISHGGSLICITMSHVGWQWTVP